MLKKFLEYLKKIPTYQKFWGKSIIKETLERLIRNYLKNFEIRY